MYSVKLCVYERRHPNYITMLHYYSRKITLAISFFDESSLPCAGNFFIYLLQKNFPFFGEVSGCKSDELATSALPSSTTAYSTLSKNITKKNEEIIVL